MQKFKQLAMVQEIRAANDEGIIEGYAAVWNTIDSYNSRFQKGCFKKTLENRKDKIRVLWNHDDEQPIGKLIDIKEDDHGLFIRAQLITEIEKAKDVFNLIKNGAIDCFSFGFRTIKDKYEDGVQVITEVMLGEVSPVVFEANPASKITNFRAIDFLETDDAKELARRGYRLIESLEFTLDDIKYEVSNDEMVSKTSQAIDDFKTAYVQWIQEIVDLRSGGVRMQPGFKNELSGAFRSYLDDQKITIEQLAQRSVFTIDELKKLKSGKVINDHDRLKVLSDDLYLSHQNQRGKAVETLCNELRAGLNPAEATRISALLNRSLGNQSEVDEIAAYMKNFRMKLQG